MDDEGIRKGPFCNNIPSKKLQHGQSFREKLALLIFQHSLPPLELVYFPLKLSS